MAPSARFVKVIDRIWSPSVSAPIAFRLSLKSRFPLAIAGPIISYRNEHGPFSKIEEIRKVMAVTNDIYDKLAPYLVTE
jgi:hypothetical protein